MEKTLLTKEGLAELKSKLDNLLNVERAKVIEELKVARQQGDLSENADYDAAREKQGQIETKIKELQYVLDNHTIIVEKKAVSKSDEKVVKVGNKIKVKNIGSTKAIEYKIVGSFEANPFENKISNESPLAQALLGKKEGDTVKVKSVEPYKTKILKITK